MAFFKTIAYLFVLCAVAQAQRGGGGGGDNSPRDNGGPGPGDNNDGPRNNIPRPIDAAGTTAATNTYFIRPDDTTGYADGISQPTGQDRPSAREVSNAIFDQAEGVSIESNVRSALLVYFGQFLDHDITLDSSSCGNDGEPMNIAIPAGDPIFDPDNAGGVEMHFNRSPYCEDASGHREHQNGITAFVDASNVYGSTQDVSDKLREGQGGRLWISGENMPPNAAALNITMAGCADCYAVGDVRGNENIVLTAFHIIFLREHNRIANNFEEQNPGWTDQEIFNAARKELMAEMQAIVYYEYIPALLGDTCPNNYNGFRDNVNPQIVEEFAVSGYRFGHSGIPDTILMAERNGNVVEELFLKDMFFRPTEVTPARVSQAMKGLSDQPAQNIDNKAVHALRNVLFPQFGGFDLIALNIQRGRDHAVSDYNTLREAYNLPRQQFRDISNDQEVNQALRDLYENENNIDAFVGSLSEPSFRNSELGELNSRMVCEQFRRLRDADPWYFERDGQFSSRDVERLRNTRLRDIVSRNSPGLNRDDLREQMFLLPQQDRPRPRPNGGRNRREETQSAYSQHLVKRSASSEDASEATSSTQQATSTTAIAIGSVAAAVVLISGIVALVSRRQRKETTILLTTSPEVAE